MTNNQVFKAFALRQSGSGNSVRSERTDHGVVLYSYSTPIAYFRDDADAPVFTTRKFSVTTSKQQSQARECFSTLNTVDNDQFKYMAAQAGASFLYAR